MTIGDVSSLRFHSVFETIWDEVLETFDLLKWSSRFGGSRDLPNGLSHIATLLIDCICTSLAIGCQGCKICCETLLATHNLLHPCQLLKFFSSVLLIRYSSIHWISLGVLAVSAMKIWQSVVKTNDASVYQNPKKPRKASVPSEFCRKQTAWMGWPRYQSIFSTIRCPRGTIWSFCHRIRCWCLNENGGSWNSRW